MRKTGWKGINSYSSLSRPSNVLCLNLTNSSRPNFPSKQIKLSQPARQLSMSTKMRSQNLMLSTSATAAQLEKSADFDTRYRPFLLDEQTRSTDWISALELETVTEMARRDLLTTSQPLRVLVLYGSLRKRYSCYLPQTLLNGVARFHSGLDLPELVPC